MGFIRWIRMIIIIPSTDLCGSLKPELPFGNQAICTLTIIVALLPAANKEFDIKRMNFKPIANHSVWLKPFLCYFQCSHTFVHKMTVSFLQINLHCRLFAIASNYQGARNLTATIWQNTSLRQFQMSHCNHLRLNLIHCCAITYYMCLLCVILSWYISIFWNHGHLQQHAILFNLMHIQLFEFVWGTIKITCTWGCDSKSIQTSATPSRSRRLRSSCSVFPKAPIAF